MTTDQTNATELADQRRELLDRRAAIHAEERDLVFHTERIERLRAYCAARLLRETEATQ
jgi:hypothetical protein